MGKAHGNENVNCEGDKSLILSHGTVNYRPKRNAFLICFRQVRVIYPRRQEVYTWNGTVGPIHELAWFPDTLKH